MKQLRFPALAAAVVLLGSCVVSATAICPGWRCEQGAASMGSRMDVQPAMLVVVLLAAAVLGRAGWLAVRGCRALAILQPAHGGDAAVARGRLGGRARLTAGADVAFCAGLVRPRVYLSVGVVEALDDEELEAVLIHERRHARRRDPLRRVLRQAFADVLWFAPAVAWWAQRSIRREEMSADAEAVRRVGSRPVAGALLKVWMKASGAVTNAAYGDAASARVACLLGDLTEPDSVPRRLLVMSVAGAIASIPLGLCVATLLV